MDERVQKYFYDELSQPKRLSFLREVEMNEELRQQFMNYQNMHALLNLNPEIQNHQLAEYHYNNFIRQKQQGKTGNKFLLWIGYAAAIVVLMVSSGLFTYYFTKKEPSDLPVYAEMNTLYTPAGQRACLMLQDGTEVWLNAKSSLTYPASFTGNERRVKVEGEAFFHVAQDPSKPFIVSSLDVDLKVLGTKFNLYAYPETGFVQVSLLEGSVHVFYPDKEKEGVTLQSNQQVIVHEGKMRVEPIQSVDHFLWRDGIYAFEEEPLINILKKMEIYYDVKITVKDTSIFNEHYTGKFRQRDSLDDVFRILQQIRPFSVKKDTENNTITLSKHMSHLK